MKLRSLGKYDKVCSRSKSKRQKNHAFAFSPWDKRSILSKKGKRSLFTVLGDKRVIRCTEINEPIPVATLLQQNSRSMESVGHHGRPTVRDQVRLGDHPHILDRRKKRVAGNIIPEVIALLRGGLQIEVDDVEVGGMVDGKEDTLEHIAIADGAGDKVREAGRGRRGAEMGGGRGGAELGLDEDGSVEGGEGIGGMGEERGREEGKGDEGEGVVRGGEGGEKEEEDKGDGSSDGQGSDPLPLRPHRRRPRVQGVEGRLHLPIWGEFSATIWSHSLLKTASSSS